MKNILYYISIIAFQLSINNSFAQEGVKPAAIYNMEADQKTSVNIVYQAKKMVTIDKNTKNVSVKMPTINQSANKVMLDEVSVTDIEETERKKAKEISSNYYFTYLTSNQSSRNFEALKKAYEMAPFNQELQFEMVKFYEQSNKLKSKKDLLKTLQTNLSPALKEYAYNTLMSVEKNGILITYGKNDTYPIWVLQELEGKRKDVKVLNYDLLMDDNYRAKKNKELGLSLANKYDDNLNILKDVATNNNQKNIYFSLTVSHTLLKQLKNNLYPVGLAFKYTTGEFQNLQNIKSNWETKFKKSSLKSNVKSGEVSKMELNYLLPLTQLARYYKNNSNSASFAEVKTICVAIAKRNGKESEVLEIFKNM